jgi:hypothetical protein
MTSTNTVKIAAAEVAAVAAVNPGARQRDLIDYVNSAASALTSESARIFASGTARQIAAQEKRLASTVAFLVRKVAASEKVAKARAAMGGKTGLVAAYDRLFDAIYSLSALAGEQYADSRTIGAYTWQFVVTPSGAGTRVDCQLTILDASGEIVMQDSVLNTPKNAVKKLLRGKMLLALVGER